MEEIEAAVVREPGESRVERLTLAEPGPNEVVVDVRATGVCHSDYERFAGNAAVPMPVVLGHEGAGVVEAVGEGVTTVEPGDRVVCAVVPACGVCPECQRGRPFLCEPGFAVSFAGTMLDGTHRLFDGDQPVNHFFAQSSFATRCIVQEGSAVAIDETVSFPAASLLGCGATTGLGAVFNTADVATGESVAVFGCGGVGMAAIMAAEAVGAHPIVAVDLVPDRLDTARELGATHTVDASDRDPVEAIDDLGGVAYALEFTGNTAVMAQALDVLVPAGTAVLSGSAREGEEIPFDARGLMFHRDVSGNIAGACRPQVDIPRYAALHESGRIDLELLVTHTFALDELDKAFATLERGEGIRSVVTQ
jgi:S-(hydroxymethyl)glutathione dehydrogenase/alcohol dehydrogenase